MRPSGRGPLGHGCTARLLIVVLGATAGWLQAGETAVPWVRAGLNTNRPVWGIAGHLLWGLPPATSPLDGPRGLIRLRSPVLAGGGYDLINFIAIEPVVNGRKGFSELERSRLDGQPGKRLWVRGTESSEAPTDGLSPGRLTRLESGVERLSVEVSVERFENGAHVRLTVTQRSDAPDEIELTVHAEPDSAPIEYCILTATMGNKARARRLWLKDGPVSSLDLFGDYRGADFTEHRVFPLERLWRSEAGDVWAAITTDEAHPAAVDVGPAPAHWRYAGQPVTQYWKKPAGTWRDDLHVAVNARYTYWLSRHPIPGGVSFENFELRERFYPGQRWVFGITPKAPAELGFAQPRTQAAAEAFPVSIRVDAAQSRGPLKPIWRFFGADEPNYAYMPHGRKLLAALGALAPSQVYFRAHNLLTSGDGTPALKWGSTGAYREDAQGKPVYDWTILDRIFDTYLERGVRPYVQIGFMPRDLSIRPEPYQHRWTPQAKYDEIYTGWAYPPKDYARWGELVFQWAKHCLERYGQAEVEQWYWQTWNEPNIGYWRGTRQEFFKLHDFAIHAVRRALPAARVGGPDVAGGPGGSFLREFIEHCLRGTNHVTGRIGTPLDFVSFHAKGRPRFEQGHVRMGLAAQLGDIDAAFAVIAAFPELKGRPVIIGECDPEGCAACQGPHLGYRHGTMYSSYTAASFARIHDLADKHGVNLEGALTWAFTFEDQPYFAGFRALASNGLDLPVFNVFRMFSRMRGQRLGVSSSADPGLESILRGGVRGAPDVSALASLEQRAVGVLVWHYHDDDLPGPPAAVEVRLEGLPFPDGSAHLTHYRIDAEHSNSFEAWKRMGAPPAPTPEQYAALERAGQLAVLGQPELVRVELGRATLRLLLPRQAVSLLELRAEAADRAP